MNLPRSIHLLIALSALTRNSPAADSPEARFAQMSPAEVRAVEMDVMRRVADLALIPPTLNTSPLPQYDYDKLDYGMTIGIGRRQPQGVLRARHER
jgi:sialidase-1